MASSEDGMLLFLAVKDCIYVYNSADFTSNHPPAPSSFFPFNPVRILRPTRDQVAKICTRLPGTRIEPREITFNHIRAGWIGDAQESLVAVGEFGTILVWNVGNLDDCPVLIESVDFESTWGIAISPNNYVIATSSNSHKVTLFHFPSKQAIILTEEQSIHGHNIPSLDFSPCGRWLVSCSIDGKVALWSIFGQEVTRFDLKRDGWGWLVRFVPPDQSVNIGNKLYIPSNSKRYYTSAVKDDIENDDLYEDFGGGSVDEHDIHDFFNEILQTDESEVEEDEDYEETGSDEEESETSSESEPDNTDITDHAYIINNSQNTEIASNMNSRANQLLQQLLEPNESGVHLAEGAGDTWPTDSEIDANEQNRLDYLSEYYDSSFESDMSEDSDYCLDSEDSFDGSEDLDSEDSDSYDIDDSELDGQIKNVEKFKVNFVNTENISLFPHNPPATLSATCPYDIVYCTRESFLIISPSEPWIKVRMSKISDMCMYRQNIRKALYNNSLLEAFARRLSMGEWISDLGVFLLIDSCGHLLTLSPKIDAWKSHHFDTIVVPDVRQPRSEIIGFATVKKVDAEYGTKVHVYLVCADGTFRLYEAAKTDSDE